MIPIGKPPEHGMVSDNDATVVGNCGHAVPDIAVEYLESGVQVSSARLDGNRI